MNGAPIAEALGAAGQFLASVKQGDQVAIVTFGHAASVVQPLTSDTGALADGARRALALRPHGGHGAQRRRRDRRQGAGRRAPVAARRVLIVMTDGKDSSSLVTMKRRRQAGRRRRRSRSTRSP